MRVAHCCFEHADQTSDFPFGPSGSPPTAPQERELEMEITSRPIHVESTEDDLVARVAAIDVAKDSGMVCTRLPDEARPGKRATTVWNVRARTGSISALAKQLRELRVERVVLEATSDYWRPFYYLLEAAGLTVWLVNARDVKNVPGRPKTDKLDAVWLAKLNERGMLRPSFVPPVEIRVLRDYTRLRSDLTAERSRHIQRIEKLLEDALIKLSSVATNIMGVSARAMLAALINGQRDPHTLADLAKGRLRVKNTALIEALTGLSPEGWQLSGPARGWTLISGRSLIEQANGVARHEGVHIQQIEGLVKTIRA